MSSIRNRIPKKLSKNNPPIDLESHDPIALDSNPQTVKFDQNAHQQFRKFLTTMSSNQPQKSQSPHTEVPGKHSRTPRTKKSPFRIRATRSTVRKGLTRLNSPGSLKKTKKKNSKQETNSGHATEQEKKDDPNQEKVEKAQDDIIKDLVVHKNTESASAVTQSNWNSLPDGKGVFLEKQLQVWVRDNVQQMIPVKDPRQLLRLGTNEFGGELQQELYKPGEGFVIHYVAKYFANLPPIGYHIGAFKAMHYVIRGKNGCDVDDDPEILEDHDTLIDCNMKYLAFLVGDFMIPQSAISHVRLLDAMTISEISDKIDMVARADPELYVCYNAIGQMLSMGPEERGTVPELFRYLYLVELYVTDVAEGEEKKESVELVLPVQHPETPSADFIRKASAVESSKNRHDEDEEAETEDEEEDDDDEDDGLDGPPTPKRPKNTDQTSTGLDKGKGKIGTESNAPPEVQAKKNHETVKDKEAPVKNPADPLAGYVSNEIFLKTIRHLNNQITSITNQNKEIMRSISVMNEKIGSFDHNLAYSIGRIATYDLAYRDLINAGQRANQVDPDPASRKERTEAITKTLERKAVPESSKAISEMNDADKELIKMLTKPKVLKSEMEKLLVALQTRLIGTSKESLGKALTAQKLLSKSLRDRVAEGIKELPVSRESIMQDAEALSQDADIQKILGIVEGDAERLTKESESTKKRARKEG